MRQAGSIAALLSALVLASCATTMPAPAPPSIAQPPRPMVPLAALVHRADYPAEAIAGRHEGMVRFTLTVGANGRVTGCLITRSSGSRYLDSATCGLMVRRARFAPARGPSGTPEEGTFADSLVWRL